MNGAKGESSVVAKRIRMRIKVRRMGVSHHHLLALRNARNSLRGFGWLKVLSLFPGWG